MNVRELIAELRTHPADLNLVAFSSNPEKWGEIEDLTKFQLYEAKYNHIFNGTLFVGTGGERPAFVVISTGVRLGLNADRAIGELESFAEELPVVFEPYGSNAAHDFVEVVEVRHERFGIVSRKFRDITDGRDYVETVYEEDPLGGRPKLLLCGRGHSASV
jgi:hypothetical protein